MATTSEMCVTDLLRRNYTLFCRKWISKCQYVPIMCRIIYLVTLQILITKNPEDYCICFNKISLLHSAAKTFNICFCCRLFGFPEHYTDVGNIPPTRRQKLIGKAWSVPLIKHILAPLRAFYRCIPEGPRVARVSEVTHLWWDTSHITLGCPRVGAFKKIKHI